jgi:hypothetical protein
MMEEIARLSAALAERMRELRADPTDPRLAPLLAQYQALVRQHMAAKHMATATPATPTAAPAADYDFDLPAELDALPRSYLDSCPAQAFVQAPALSDSEAGRRILALPPADRVRMVVATYRAWSSERWGGMKGGGLRRVVSDLLRAKLPLADADAIALVQSATREGFTCASYSPNQAVLGALERHVAGCGLGSQLRRAIEGLLSEMALQGAERNVQGCKLRSGVEALLAHKNEDAANTLPLFKPKDDAWGVAVMARLTALPADMQGSLGVLLMLASQGGKNAKPAKGWLKSATQALERFDSADLGEHLIDFIECHEPGTPITLENQETLRALLWLAAMAAPDASGRPLEAFAQKCLTFSATHFAYLSLVLGNASIHAFALMPGTAGVGSLTRLRRRLKRPGEIKTVDKALAALAQARGMGAGELEEIGLPDYGFAADGRIEIAVGPATAVLAIIDANTLETSWRAADGTPLKGPPAEVKTHHVEALKEFKARTKEISETLKAQCARLDPTGRAARPAAGPYHRGSMPAGGALPDRRREASHLLDPSRLLQHPHGAERSVSVHRAGSPECGRASAASVRGRQYTVADPLEGVPAGRRRQDQGRLDRVADQTALVSFRHKPCVSRPSEARASEEPGPRAADRELREFALGPGSRFARPGHARLLTPQDESTIPKSGIQFLGKIMLDRTA